MINKMKITIYANVPDCYDEDDIFGAFHRAFEHCSDLDMECSSVDVKRISPEETRVIRKFDDMGRIVIPIAAREAAFGTKNVEGKCVEVVYETDGTVILSPYLQEE